MPKSKEPAYGTSRGVPVTEDLIEVAREAERGYDVDSLRRRGGRPPLGAKPSEVVPVRLDPDLHRALEDRAKEETTSASEVIRRALRAYLDAPQASRAPPPVASIWNHRGDNRAAVKPGLGRPDTTSLAPRVSPHRSPDRASPSILGPLRRADNSGLSAHPPPAETHKCTAFGLI